jgi:hypothetical protein
MVMCFLARTGTDAFNGKGLRGSPNLISCVFFILHEVLLVMCFSARTGTDAFKGEGLRGGPNLISCVFFIFHEL